jgi:hypothetical protein
MNERTFGYLQNLVAISILLPFIIKGAERDKISHHGWYVLDAGERACHPDT